MMSGKGGDLSGKRTECVEATVTADEKQKIETAAKRDGRSVSGWLRWLARQELKRVGLIGGGNG